MPYITQERRNSLYSEYEEIKVPENCGDLNYVICRLIDRYIGESPNYAKLNEVCGVLTVVIQELSARVLRPYENVKCHLNGDVWMERDI